MSFLSKLLGNSKDKRLMQLLLDLSTGCDSSLTLVNELLNHYDDDDQVQSSCFRIQKLESEGDELVKQIVDLLGEISITSWISHEMVLRLTQALDEILDNAQCLVRFVENYRIAKLSNSMLLMGKILEEGGGELAATMALFCRTDWQKHTGELLVHTRKIRELEHQGDNLKAQGLHALLNVENAGQPITMRDLAEFRNSEKILEVLELLTDNIHHLSTNVMQCLGD